MQVKVVKINKSFAVGHSLLIHADFGTKAGLMKI